MEQVIHDDFREMPTPGKFIRVYMPRDKERYGPIFFDGDEKFGLVFFEKPFYGLQIEICIADLKIAGNNVGVKYTVVENPNRLTAETLNSTEFTRLLNFSINDLFEKIANWEQEKSKQ